MAQHPMKVVLLDLDGTLTKSDGGIIGSVIKTFEDIGRPVPDAAELRRFIGPAIIESLRRNHVLGVVLNCSFERPFHSVFNMLELLRLNVICYLPKLGMYPVIPQHSATNLRIELRNGFGVAESTVIHAEI